MVTQELLDSFQSGNSVFDDFLKEKAGYWQDNSEAATYVFVTKDDRVSGKINRIYGFVSINACVAESETQFISGLLSSISQIGASRWLSLRGLLLFLCLCRDRIPVSLILLYGYRLLLSL